MPNFWSKTSCVSALAVLALSTLGGSLVYIAMTKEIDAAMVTLGPAFTYAKKKLAGFMQNYTGTINRLKLSRTSPKEIFDRCQPPNTEQQPIQDRTHRDEPLPENGFYYSWNPEPKNRERHGAWCSIRFESWDTTDIPGWKCQASRFLSCENFTRGDFPLDKFCVAKPYYGGAFCDLQADVCQFFDDSAQCFKDGVQEVTEIDRTIQDYIAVNDVKKSLYEQDVNDYQRLINKENVKYSWEIPFVLLFGTIFIGGFLYLLYLRKSKENAYSEYIHKPHALEECHLEDWQLSRLEGLSKRLNEPLQTLPVEQLLERLKVISLNARDKEVLFWLYVHFKEFGVVDLFRKSILAVHLQLNNNH